MDRRTWVESNPPIIFGDKDAFTAQYKVGEMIARGGTSRVHEGVRNDGTLVALKFIPARFINNWDRLYNREMPLEVSTLYRLRGTKGIIYLYDYYFFNGEYIIAMQRPKNFIDLRDYILQERRLKEEEAQQLFGQIVEAIILCYEAGILFTDLEARNVLLDLDTKETFLIDFGSAEFIPNGSCVQIRIPGTQEVARHMAEAQYYREKNTVKKAALLLYRMVTGETGYSLTGEEDVSESTLRGLVISNHCKDMIGRGLFREGRRSINLHGFLSHSWMKISVRASSSASGSNN